MPAGDYNNCRKCGMVIFGANFLCHDCALKMESYGASYDIDGQVTSVTDDIEYGARILAATLNNMLKRDAKKHMDTLAKSINQPPISNSSFEYFWNNYIFKVDKVTPEQEETLDDLYYQMIDNTEKLSSHSKCEKTVEKMNRDEETLEEIFDNFFNENPTPPPTKIVSKEFDELFKDVAEPSTAAKSDKRKTLVVNLFAGPGAGKSTLAAGVFYELKSRGINCELATEFVKDLVWEERHKAINNQIYIFAKQHHRIARLLGEVDVIVTDSPLLLTLVYGKAGDEILKRLAKLEHDKLRTFNCFIKRDKRYNPIGRNHTYEEARTLDIEIANMLDDENVVYEVYFGNAEGKDKIVNKVIRILGEL